MKADLHIHSVFSDGSDSRENILQKAAAVGIKVLHLLNMTQQKAGRKALCLAESTE